jgi:hypothetical protein
MRSITRRARDGGRCARVPARRPRGRTTGCRSDRVARLDGRRASGAGWKEVVRRGYFAFAALFPDSALTFCRKESFGAALHFSMMTGIAFSVPSTSSTAASGLPPLP